MTDTAVQTAATGKPGFFTTSTLQKAVAFVVLIALIAFFSLFASNFATGSNMVRIITISRLFQNIYSARNIR